MTNRDLPTQLIICVDAVDYSGQLHSRRAVHVTLVAEASARVQPSYTPLAMAGRLQLPKKAHHGCSRTRLRPGGYVPPALLLSGSLAPTALSITCQTSWSSRFSFQMPYAVPNSTGGTATSPIAPLTAASTHS